MRKIILILMLFCFSSLPGLAPLRKTLYIERPIVIKPYEKLRKAIIWVESKNDPMAYNKKEGAVGLYQIRKIRLDDFNKRTKSVYKLSDMYNPDKAKSVFLWYATKKHYSDIESISRCWNGGENGMKIKATKSYYYKVQKALELLK
jgi:hypothetical protein